jgi:DNA-binding response OmpR family regulator
MSDTLQSEDAAALAGKHVLLVEDEFLIAIDIERILSEGVGAKVTTTHRTALAFEIISSQGPFDVAVLDFKLDHETSLPIAERLGAAGVPFVFLTGAPAEAGNLAHFGGVPIVAKPFDEDTLLAALKGAIAARR